MEDLEKFEIPIIEFTRVTLLEGGANSTTCGCPNDCTKMATEEGEVNKA